MAIEFIEDGKEILKDIENKVGKKGLVLILGGLGIIAVYLASKSFNKSSSTTNDMVPATGYIGYPEAEENADVIISELTDEITGSGASITTTITDSRLDILDDLQERQDNLLSELDELKDTLTGFTNIEQAKGDEVNKENSTLTNGTVGGDFVNTDKGTIKDTVTTTAEKVVEVPVTPNYAEGSGAQKLHDYMEENVGKSNYTQIKTETQAGQVYNDRDRVTNEYGGETHVNVYGDKMTVTKTDANGVVKSTEVTSAKDTLNLGDNTMLASIIKK